MILNIVDDIREYFQNFWTSITIGNIIMLFFGILLGAFLVLLIYVLRMVMNLKKNQKELSDEPTKHKKKHFLFKNKKKEEKDEEEEKKKALENRTQVNQLIENSKSRFVDLTKDKNIGEKLIEAKDIVFTLVTDIATLYFPTSLHPVLELNVEEILTLDTMIVDEINKLFEKKGIRYFKTVSISKYMNYYEKGKVIVDSKLAKDVKKLHLPEAATFFTTIKNSVMGNVGTFLKKGFEKFIAVPLQNRIILYLIEYIGIEVAKVYSKQMFTQEEENLALEKQELNNDLNEDSFNIEKINDMVSNHQKDKDYVDAEIIE